MLKGKRMSELEEFKQKKRRKLVNAKRAAANVGTCISILIRHKDHSEVSGLLEVMHNVRNSLRRKYRQMEGSE